MTIGTLVLLAAASYIIMLAINLRTTLLLNKIERKEEFIERLLLVWGSNWGESQDKLKKKLEAVINDSKISGKKRRRSSSSDL